MESPRKGSPGRLRGLRWALWSGLTVGGLLPSIGCQAEMAGMTLPSGKYFHDDVQYFPPGPDFPWANTQAATQRALMQSRGIDTGVLPGQAPAPGPGVVVPGQGLIDPAQVAPGGNAPPAPVAPGVVDPAVPPPDPNAPPANPPGANPPADPAPAEPGANP